MQDNISCYLFATTYVTAHKQPFCNMSILIDDSSVYTAKNKAKGFLVSVQCL